jgi:predicted phage baseplate assembly protein
VPSITLNSQKQAAANGASDDASDGTAPIVSWSPQRDLLDSQATDHHFVVEVESDGTAYLRFGDGQYGAAPEEDATFTAIYRVGNGVRGNVGADALYHIVSLEDRIQAINNPLSAAGGIEPETIEDIRQKASGSFLTQERGVTPEDYKALAEGHLEVSRANALMRWTGSWYTVFLAVERKGGMPVDEAFKQKLLQYMERFRMAGGDVVIVEPVYVPLEVEMSICVQSNYLLDDVEEALLKVFSNRLWPDGVRGIFSAGNYTFGQTVYLNTLLLAASRVSGVAAVKEIKKFQRLGSSGSWLEDGEITLDWREIARLDNDPHHPERGLFYIHLEYCA